MKIRKITIENFRSIKKAEIEVTDFNIFVGQNNCGKTNLFEALEFFFNGYKGNLQELKYLRDNDLEMFIEVEFCEAQDGLHKMQNERNKTTLSSKLGAADIVSFRRCSSDSKKRQMFIEGNEISSGTGFDAALNDFLPKFEYIFVPSTYPNS